MMNKKLLLIDDDKMLSNVIVDVFQLRGFTVHVAHTAATGMDSFLTYNPEIVLLDQNLPDSDGVEVCRKLVELRPEVKIIFITAFPTYRYAVEATKLGAYDYLTKPFDTDELFITVRNAMKSYDLEHFKEVQTYRNLHERVESKVVGRSPAAGELRKQISLAAAADFPILITGETGVGKNVVARLIHQIRSPQQTMLTINCSAMPEHLIESELFGHERGAFTGAITTRKGIFELATGGSLILDEIGDMPYQLQSKLLNVLEEKKVRRVGGKMEISIDVKVIALTNADIEAAMETRHFRRDLFYRLTPIRIHLPPLRDRIEDLEDLYETIMMSLNNRVIPLPPDQLEAMKAYHWPGNIRELKNIIERSLLLLQHGEPLQPGTLLSVTSPGRRTELPIDRRQQRDLREIIPLEELEIQAILNAIDVCEGRKMPAARALGISLNKLKRKLAAHQDRISSEQTES